MPVVRFARDEYRLGGAANVAANLRALGVEPRLSALIDWRWAPWLLAVWPQVVARDLLGWEPTKALRDGLAETVAYLKGV